MSRKPTLIATTEHHMEWSQLVLLEHVAPQGVRAAEVTRVNAEAEAVATVEHYVHGLTFRRNPEVYERPAANLVCNLGLGVGQFYFEVESPERHAMLCMQSQTLNLRGTAPASTLLTLPGVGNVEQA